MDGKLLLKIGIALSVAVLSPVRAIAQVQPAPSIQNQVAIVPQSSAITITFPISLTVNASQKRSLTTAAFLARPLLDSNGNVVADTNSPINVEIQPTKGGAQIKAVALVVNGRIIPIQAIGPLIPDRPVTTTGNSQKQGFYNSLAGSVFNVLLSTSGVANKLGTDTSNSIGNSLGTGLVTISGMNSSKTTHQVEIPQGAVYILTLDTSITIPPKLQTTSVATQTPNISTPIAIATPTQTPAAPLPTPQTIATPPTQKAATLIPTSVGIAVTQVAQASTKPNDVSSTKIIYVNPTTGTDSDGHGSTEVTPTKTIAYAVKQAQPGTVIQLAPGTYNDKTGEVFPLVLKSGMILRGEPANKGQNTIITGGGDYLSPTFARQNITIQAENDSTISGVTITNQNTRGTALWIESTNPTVTDNTFTGSNREGIFVTGTGTPKIQANLFIKNGGNGISLVRSAQGEIRNNLFQETGFGMAIGGNASPLISGNQFLRNQDGMFISDAAHPMLRNNTIKNNQRDGVVIAACSLAQPDLGTNSNAGGNIFGDNGQYDIHNGGAKSLDAIGNQLDPKRVAAKQQCS